ncbi:O-antigen translocase [Changchengzhania lutea]|uniref:O-antigen translocase n=1 Tax=Changchengzhania lutea TaxID=2049305 RepID=UPI00115C88B5|nr:O-antigen translocase [Changchengzhania lutea]
MRKYFNIDFKNNMLLKIASFNSIGVFVRLITGFILSKAIAYFLMPQGMAITGNLGSFLTSSHGLSTGGLQSGVIKYTAEHKDDDKNLTEIISTSFFLTLGLTFIVSTVLIVFSNEFNNLIFANKNYSYAIKILGLVLPLYTFNTFLLSIINGLGRYKRIISINAIGYIVNVIIVVFLLWKYNLDGAIIAMVSMPSFLLLITFFWVKDVRFILTKINLSRFSITYFNGLMSFIIMAVFSALTIPIVHILVKNHIIDTIGLKEAGYWEAIIKISQYYLVFIMSLYTFYLLPKLAYNDTNKGFKEIVLEFYKTILPYVIIGFFIIYVSRYWIIRITLTKDFLPVQDLFFWQLIGDFFKVISFVIAYQMQAKKMLFWYLIGEFLYAMVVYFSSTYLIDKFNVTGAVMGHAFSYMFYFVLMLIIFRKSLLTFTSLKVEE